MIRGTLTPVGAITGELSAHITINEVITESDYYVIALEKNEADYYVPAEPFDTLAEGIAGAGTEGATTLFFTGVAYTTGCIDEINLEDTAGYFPPYFVDGKAFTRWILYFVYEDLTYQGGNGVKVTHMIYGVANGVDDYAVIDEYGGE